MNKRKKKPNVVAMIPARIGSTRLVMKNLALLNGRPLISYAITAAVSSGSFSRVVVNSESPVFAEIAKRYGAEFYLRPPQWATSEAKSDYVVYDFVKHNPCDIVAWVNTISPLQTSGDIRGAVDRFVSDGLDTLITVKDEQVHCVYKGRPVNFKTSGLFAKTQDLEPVKSFVYSVMMWRVIPFIKTFEKKGSAFFCGKVGYHNAGKLAGIIIKRAEDLVLADCILKGMGRNRTRILRYYNSAKHMNGRDV